MKSMKGESSRNSKPISAERRSVHVRGRNGNLDVTAVDISTSPRLRGGLLPSWRPWAFRGRAAPGPLRLRERLRAQGS